MQSARSKMHGESGMGVVSRVGVSSVGVVSLVGVACRIGVVTLRA